MSNNKPVRVRIGPSPTGEPHVGTAYIALFNLAFARKHGGKFVLRIEDTDQERSKPEWERQIMEALNWLGLTWDEGPDVGGPYGPYRQSERKAIHQEHVDQLVAKGAAYRCFCSAERLDQVREEQKKRGENPKYDRHCRDLSEAEVAEQLKQNEPFTIRMKMPLTGSTIVKDRLRGDVEINNEQIDDQVLIKSDGFPTYHLANVVDDHLMGITHVIRAEEWISSTPKHVQLYAMFGWEEPEWIHMPLLRNPDKGKISKRKSPVSILDYKKRGFLPEVVNNFLAQLGWSMPDGREQFSFDDFVENFTWDRMSLGGPIFDLAKFTDLNGRYFRGEKTQEQLVQLLREELFSKDYLAQIVPLLQERINKLEDFITKGGFFFVGDVEIDPADLLPKKRTFKELRQVLEAYAEDLDREASFTAESLETFSRSFGEKNEWKPRDLFMPIRLATTGRKDTPPLFETMAVMGRPLVRRRLRSAIELLKKAAQEASKQKKPKVEASGEKPAITRLSSRVVVKGTSEICLPEEKGTGVERLAKAALYIEDGLVKWIGPEKELPEECKGAEIFHAGGRAVLPALVDCHTHLIHGGDRIEDFSRRARGMTYAEIAAEGGGIHTTVQATRKAKPKELKKKALATLEQRARYGIGTTEIKSGYGLSVEHELKMLNIATDLASQGWDLERTLLAAHVVPKDCEREVYLEQIVKEMIPQVAKQKLARFVDVFVEQNAYTVAEAERIFAVAKEHGLFCRLHADQITAGGGAELAASVAASSADHLERISAEGIEALAKAAVVATLLPGAMTYLGDQAQKLGRRLVDAGVEVAVATDANPGSSPTHNLPLMAALAVTQMGLSAEESLRAITLGAAHALKRDDIGTLKPGSRARFIVLEERDSRALVASFGEPVVRTLVECAL